MRYTGCAKKKAKQRQAEFGKQNEQENDRGE
jgi:hypothetical protein